jgi:succinoglycan biosynthesis transport protein ExoP
MDFQDFMAALRRGWKVLVGLVVVGAVVGGVLALTAQSTYRSVSKVYISLTGVESPQELLGASSYARQQAPAFAELVTSDAVLQPVADDLGESGSLQDLRSDVSARAVENGPIVEITALAGSGQDAADLANSAADALIDTATTLDGGGDTGLELSVIQQGPVADDPVTPNLPVNILLGVLVGLVLGLLVVLAAYGRAPARGARAL